jgi:hypothetical protein
MSRKIDKSSVYFWVHEGRLKRMGNEKKFFGLESCGKNLYEFLTKIFL